MRAAQIDNGIVVNILEVDSLDFLPNLVDASSGGNIGDHYVNGQFIPPETTGPTKEEQRAAIQTQIDALELSTLLNRGSREFEIVSIQDLANRQAVILQPSQPDKTVQEIAAIILASRPYYPKLIALDAQFAALRAALAAI